MHSGNKSEESPRLSVDMALSESYIQSDATAAIASKTDDFTILLSNLSLSPSHTRSTTTPDPAYASQLPLETSSGASSVSAPSPTKKSPHQHIPTDRTTTVAHGGRQFSLSPRAPLPPGAGAGTRNAPTPRVKALRKPDSGILLSRSGRLYCGGAEEYGDGATSVGDSMAAGSVSVSDYAGMGVGQMGGGGVGGWCRDVVGREMMAAERVGWQRGVRQGPPAGGGCGV
ncbi:uncharacterized protein LAJ45_01752 [Morchella importuna]|uniref:uncharacterized protein n=1 Tax=Morchella importuna TaxID=1174673 RepID=UPI001E8DFD14|nr:uncharacterized protein LAJ45_01752 [Morchella importuna]KAH8153985.1 hypothetical protein LAJ45_01752 [Morchella importuna]